MKKLLSFIVLMCGIALVGCQQPAEPTATPGTDNKVVESKTGSSAVGGDQELHANPNAKMVEPGSALGNK